MELKLFGRSVHLALNGFNVSRQMEFQILKHYLNLNGYERVLDVACGDGYWTAKLARMAQAVIGFDFNLSRLRQAKALSNGLIGGLIGCDAHVLPFQTGVFDAAVGICVLEHFDDDLKALSELRRVLKPGARLALTVDSFSVPDVSEAEKAAHARQYHVVHWYRRANLEATLKRAGFKMVESEYLLKSKPSATLYRMAKVVPKLAYFLFPLTYPISRISDRWSSADDYGYKLAVLAVAE